VELEILTAERKLFSGKVKTIVVPGSKGQFTVLLNHAPIISTLIKGQVRIQGYDGSSQSIAIDGGVIEVKKNKIIVLADMV